MKVLDNGIRLKIINTTSELTSICIGFEAGASVEMSKLGVAHATEHMIYKGTKNRSEDNINKELSNIFAFQNAMTNYPYVIFYGSFHNDDFNKAIDLFSDILINPNFSEEGFKEEMDVIIQELNEWDEDLEQFTEDKLYFNSIDTRLKYPIIGVIEDLKKLSLEDIKDFYNKHYYPKNMVITVVSSLEEKNIIDIINKYFGYWIKEEKSIIKEEEKHIKATIFNDYREGTNNAKIEIIYDIQKLSNYELGVLRVFDEYLCAGVNSILFNELRTKRGLVYDVLSNISYEKHIGLYKICCTTSKDKAMKVIEVYKEALSKKVNFDNINEILKRIKLKKLFKQEQGIVLAKESTVNEIMKKEIELVQDVDISDIVKVRDKVLINPAIEIITAKE